MQDVAATGNCPGYTQLGRRKNSRAIDEQKLQGRIPA
jgi:hypothetical protein